MSESSNQPQRRRRFSRTFWIWLTLFVLILAGMAIVGLTTHVPQRPPYALMALITALAGASILIMMWRFIRSLRSWRNVRRALVGAAAFATLVGLFYTVENIRGKRAWTKCKQELEAKGLVLDWNAYIPPPVPDDQNIFKAPRMQEWFAGRGSTDLSMRLGQSDSQVPPVPVAEVTVKPWDTPVTAGEADIILRYRDSILFRAMAPSGGTNASNGEEPAYPLLIMDHVPLTGAISNLSKWAKIECSFDPRPRSGEESLLVSLRWTNVTARHALFDLLNHYDLQLTENPATGVARITKKLRNGPRILIDPAVNATLHQLIQQVLENRTNGTRQLRFTGARGFTFFSGPLNPVRPARVVVLADKTPGAKEVAEFFPWTDANRLRVEPAGSNVFRVLVSSPEFVTAGEYLATTDAFESDFDLIREAIRRPYSRIEGDYQEPAFRPIPNFVTIRNTAQVLADRTKCYLLLGEPEKALRELTLVRDLRRLLEGKPMTLVAAMINVAITGLYVETLADGLRLHAWREPQLIVLQEQLRGIELQPDVEAAFKTEPAATCRTLELAPSARFREIVSDGLRGMSARALLIRFMPRGWIYQNMAVIATERQKLLEGFDSDRGLIQPRPINRLGQRFDAGIRPYTFIAVLVMPNFTRAIQTLGYRQTLVHEALLACALERYHAARGEYPETLEALAPQFVEKIPRDIIGGEPLKYHRTSDGKFLLYSVGWNETDDGGLTASGAPARPDLDDGDWVWR